MARKKIKFGKRISLYLSNEAIVKLDNITKNRSRFIEKLILKWEEEQKRTT